MKRNDPILDEINRRVKIEDLIEASGIPLERRAGRYLRPKARGKGIHSLIVDTENNSYHHNGMAEHGDIFSWVMNREGLDFRQALESLAERASVALPKSGANSEQVMAFRIAERTKEEVFKVAQGVFEAWLWKTPQALAYVRGRGLRDESIRRLTLVESDGGLDIKLKGAGLGFSGTATAAEFEEMRQAFRAVGIDPECPAAIAVLGMQGGAEKITAWCSERKIEAHGSWITKGYIGGLMSKRFPRIIFPHWNGSTVEYLSTRVLAWQNDGTLKNADEPKSLDPWKELAGSPTPYFGFAYRRDALGIIAQEGQFDVLSTSQWGFSSVGLKGTSWQDKVDELKDLAERHRVFYMATDSDKAGQKVVLGEKDDYPLLNVTGPMTRWLRGWLKKDANDLLQWFNKRGYTDDQQAKFVQTLLDERAQPLILALAIEAGNYKKSAPRREVLMDLIVPALNRMTDNQLTEYRIDLARALYPLKNYPDDGQKPLQQLNKLLKDGKDKTKDEDGKPGEIVETMGGWYPVSEDGEKGWFLDMTYDIHTRKAQLAYRDPDGNIGTANFLDINGVRLVPYVDENMQIIDQNDLPVVLMPSALGEKKTAKELSFIIETFLRRYFLLENSMQYELASMYPFVTWNYDMFNELPYFRARGRSGSGKSEFMTRVGLLCYRMIISTGVNSIATMKYLCHIYRGTLFLDECDKFARDEFDERNVMLRVGFSKTYGKVTAMMEAQVGGVKTYKPVSARVFGPKLLTMYKSFADEGNENRCITFDLKDKEVQELIDRKIPTNDPRDVRRMWNEAQQIRNLMLRWKLETYKRTVDIRADLILRNPKVSNRVNQITMPLYILSQDDPDMLAKINKFMENSYANEVNQRSEKPEARVLDAVVAIMETETYAKYKFTGRVRSHGVQEYAFYKDIALLANQMMDKMNSREDETEEEQKRRKRKSLSPNGIGFICRDELGLETDRVGNGSVVILNTERIAILKTKYGAGDMLIDDPAGEGAATPALEEHYASQSELFED